MTFDEWWIGITGPGCLLRGENEDYHRMTWEVATNAAREACAKVAESWATEETQTTCANIAEAIRRSNAQGNKPPLTGD